MNKYAAAFLWERVAGFYKAMLLLFFTFKLIIKNLALTEFREHDDQKVQILQVKYS